MIEKTLNLIYYQLGLKLKLCDYFDGLRIMNGLYYFNVILDDPISESRDYDKLLIFSKDYNLIKIEPNGLKRVAIFPNNK